MDIENMKEDKQLQNGHGKEIDMLAIPKWDQIEKMSISELTKLRVSVDKYSEILARILRSKM